MMLQQCIRPARLGGAEAARVVSRPVAPASEICLAEASFSKPKAAEVETPYASRPWERACTVCKVLYGVTSGVWLLSAAVEFAAGHGAAGTMDLMCAVIWGLMAAMEGASTKRYAKKPDIDKPEAPAVVVKPAPKLTKNGEDWVP